MSVIETFDADAVVLVASMVVDAHQGGRACPQCTDDGCGQEAWAADILAQHAADRAAFCERVAAW
ncbi:hypothetical protein ACFO0M_10255 [Micromonospora mangrovi]|uniref:Uncharacterized protein n=2 Tax=Micromonospora TaxID=1873 RepID=A0AAU7M668_9ACTN